MFDQIGGGGEGLARKKILKTFFTYDYAGLISRVFIPFVLMVLNSALLWHRLMGKVVLAVDSDASSFLRTYAHCSKGRVS